MLETLDYTIHIGSTATFLYFDLYLYSAYAAHYIYKLHMYNKEPNFKYPNPNVCHFWLVRLTVLSPKIK